MRIRLSFFAGLMLCLQWLPTVRAQAISILRVDWTDTAHQRTLPIKIDFPKSADKPLPVVIISHGLGGSREGLAYIGEYWAAHGYVSIHIQHVGSDESIWKGKKMAEIMPAMKAAETAEQFMNRVNDVHFAIDHLKELNEDAKFPLHGKLDLDRIAMAGHSFGAVTTQAVCGQVFPGGRTVADPRIKVGVVFSPSPPRGGDTAKAFSKISIPLFHWTGTKDQVNSAISPVTPDQRREPFDAISTSDQYLVVLTDGDHGIFGGRARENGRLHPNDAAWIDLIQRGSTAFLDKYLKADKAQAAFLDDGEFAKNAKKLGTFEMKKPK